MSEYKDGLHLIPEHMRGGVERYIEHGLPHMGSFLRAVMENDFLGAFGRADEDNVAAMKGWAILIHSYAPAGCHGSPDLVDAWIKRGGLQGRSDAAGPHENPHSDHAAGSAARKPRDRYAA